MEENIGSNRTKFLLQLVFSGGDDNIGKASAALCCCSVLRMEKKDISDVCDLDQLYTL